MSESERFLEPISKFLYTETFPSMKTSITLIIVLTLTLDKNFMKFINSDIQLQQITWLQNYKIETISLGSCLFLGLLKIYRENLKGSKDEYLHVITSCCIYNLSEQSTGLNEIASMDLLSLIKVIFSKFNKLKSRDSDSEMTNCVFILNFLIGITSKILFATYTSNPFLIYSILHHSVLLHKLKESELSSNNISLICEMIDYLLPKIDDDNIMLIITSYSKTFTFIREPEYSLFNNATSIEFYEEKKRWEECMIPFIWADTLNNSLYLPNKDRILLFKT